MTLQEALQTGTPLAGELVIDSHCHMGPWYNFHIPEDGSAEAMIHSMDLLGIDVSIVSPHVCIGPDYHRGNRDVAAAAARFPGRIVPYVTVNPNAGAAEIQTEIDYWDSQGPIRAFKLHPGTHQYKASGENYFPVYEYAQAHGLPILVHSWGGDRLGGPKVLAGLAEKYPEAKFITAHSATSWQMVDEAAAETGAHDNLYFDVAGSILLYGCLEEMVERLGVGKILFGTDNPFIDPRPGLGRLLMARISDDDKRQILGLNAKRIFGL